MANVQLCVTFPFGSLVRLRASFTRAPTQGEIDDGTAEDTNDWLPVDPDTVAAQTKNPNGDFYQYDYNGSPVGELIRDDVGEYHVDVSADVAGTWYFRFYSTGNGEAANEERFKVAESVFA